MSIDQQLPRGRGAFVVAHPGHELRVHGFLETVRPIVLVLTDGSGGAGESRLNRTRRLLERAGAQPGCIFGRFSDRDLYQAILQGEFERFLRLVDELATELEGQGSVFVAGDALEGYNPSHDVCRLLIDAAVEVVAAKRGRAVPNFAFPLTGSPSAAPPGCAAQPLRLHLDADAFERKLQAAKRYDPLQHEVAIALQNAGQQTFQQECLFPVVLKAQDTLTAEEKPFYESFGEQQVAAGRYQQVLQYRAHFLPLAEAIGRHVQAVVTSTGDQRGAS